MENRIKEIILKGISENNWLDYKIKEYESGNKSRSDLLKDVIAMLNSNESYNEDKFIVMGVADNTLYLKGIDKPRDDNEYQHVFDDIEPRPKIQKGQLSVNGKTISYLYICKSNIQRPYTIKRDLRLNGYSLSLGASFIRKGTVNYPLDNEERKNLIFKTMAYQPGNTELVKQINSMNELKKLEHSDERLSGSRTINPSQNNGKFTFGINEYMFTIKFQAASNNVGRIYSDYDKVKVGKMANRDDLINTFDQSKEKIDFSSRVVTIYSGEIGVSVNKYGKVIFIEMLDIKSQSHGEVEDKISFEWSIVDYIER